jgi:hypothetical protein
MRLWVVVAGKVRGRRGTWTRLIAKSVSKETYYRGKRDLLYADLDAVDR